MPCVISRTTTTTTSGRRKWWLLQVSGPLSRGPECGELVMQVSGYGDPPGWRVTAAALASGYHAVLGSRKPSLEDEANQAVEASPIPG